MVLTHEIAKLLGFECGTENYIDDDTKWNDTDDNYRLIDGYTFINNQLYINYVRYDHHNEPKYISVLRKHTNNKWYIIRTNKLDASKYRRNNMLYKQYYKDVNTINNNNMLFN